MDKLAHGYAASRRPRIAVFTLLIGSALAQFALEARADSATGTDTTLGNALNRAPINPPLIGGRPDPDGMGTYMPAARTPTGQMYLFPRTPVEDLRRSEGGWQYFGFVEAGVISTRGDDKSYGFRRYMDVDSGLYLQNFAFSAEHAESARYLEIVGGGVGHDDQFYGVTFGRYNDWRLRGFYNETPHVFTTTFRPLWNGKYSGTQTLKPGLTAGGSATPADDNAAVAAVAAANANTEIGLVRKKGGFRFDMNLNDRWKFFAGYSHEKREGGRPFAAVWGGGGGAAPLEMVEPIDYTTHDLLAGLYYTDALSSFNLQATASLFRNDIDTLTFQTPYRIAGANGIAPGGFTQGRFDLYPDNDAYGVKGEYARRLPELMNGRFTAVVSLNTTRQDDRLIPYTTISGVSLPNVIGDNWDSSSALSRKSADARIDTRLIDLGLALNPTNTLNVKAKARYYETRNHTEYLACNPNARYRDLDGATEGEQPGALSAFGCSGVWGRLINDGSGASVLMGANPVAAGNVNLRSIPFDYRKLNLGLAADWRVTPSSSINAAYDRETYNRDHRERDKTWEDKVKLGYVNRGLPDATLRLSFEHGNRRGDDYKTLSPYADYFSRSLIPMPTTDGQNVQSWAVHMNTGLRKYDLADRRQNILNARVNYLARPDLDLGVSMQLKDIQYPDSEYGRRDRQRQNAFNFDIDWQPSPERSVYAFYSHQVSHLKQRGVPSGGGPGCLLGALTAFGPITPDNAASLCPDPGSNALYIAGNFWNVTHKDRSNTVGFGFRQDFSKARFDINYTYSRGVTEIDYSLPANTPAATAAAAGNGFPNLVTVQNVLEANLLVPLTKNVSTRLLLRHDWGRFRDWHYQGFESNPVAVNAPGTALPTATILDAGPERYRASLIGLMLQVRM